VKIASTRKLREKWEARKAAAREAYSAGLANPRSGESRKAGPGARRYARRSKSAKSAWARGWEPYRKILLGLKLPPRGPVNSQENAERVRIVCEALHKEKLRREQRMAGKRRTPKVSALRA
jgi:hypothetical protein